MTNVGKRPILILSLLALLGALVFVAPPSCEADVVHLRTGETVKGRPLREQSNENTLVIEDYLSGSVRTLAWGAVDRADKKRIWTDWGWENAALASVTGTRLEQRLEGGGTHTIRGKIVREDEAFYYLMIGGQERKVRKDSVVGKDEEEMDPRDIWSAEQLVERFVAELGKEDGVELESSRVRWRIGEYAESVGDYETARAHYEHCANDADYLNAGVAKQRLERVQAVLRDAAALQSIRDIRMALSLRSFRKVREMLDGFAEKHPGAGELIQHRIEKVKKDFEKRRAEYFQLEAKLQFPKIVEKLIKAKVQEKDIGLSDATAWTKRDLPDLAFEQLSARFQKRDDVAPEEGRAFWENRKKGSWKTVTYGSGTFIVHPPKIRPPKRKASKKRSGGGAAPQMKAPKPPTQDQWWEQKADPKQRMYWLMAFFIENSGLFEVADEPLWTACPQCNGAGLESQRLQTGDTFRFICRRCAGSQNDKRVRYR